MTDRALFSRLVRHPARKRSGCILTTPEPAQGVTSRNYQQHTVYYHHYWLPSCKHIDWNLRGICYTCWNTHALCWLAWIRHTYSGGCGWKYGFAEHTVISTSSENFPVRTFISGHSSVVNIFSGPGSNDDYLGHSKNHDWLTDWLIDILR